MHAVASEATGPAAGDGRSIAAGHRGRRLQIVAWPGKRL